MEKRQTKTERGVAGRARHSNRGHPWQLAVVGEPVAAAQLLPQTRCAIVLGCSACSSARLQNFNMCIQIYIVFSTAFCCCYFCDGRVPTSKRNRCIKIAKRQAAIIIERAVRDGNAEE